MCATVSKAQTPQAFSDLDHLEMALATRSAFFIREVAARFAESEEKSDKIKQNEIFAIEVQKMAKQHMFYVIFVFARKRIEQNSPTDANLKEHLTNLLKVYALKQLKNDSTDLFETGFFGKGSGKLIEKSYKMMLDQIRPQMVNLVEITEMFEANNLSSIGNKHGDIYELQLTLAKNSKLNQDGTIKKFFESHMKPVMTMRKAPKL